MTERLYYSDCFLQNFPACVLETSSDGCRVYLDRTAFYPSSGGQPHDLGSIGGQRLLDVVDEGDRIAHLTASPVTSPLAECSIDWPRRYDHMQQHTGQHLLSAVWVELFGVGTLSFHMGSEVSSIELDTRELSPERIERVEDRANAVVREARPVTISFVEADAVDGLRKPSEREGMLRLIEIEGLDRSACGGTHVHSTSEVGSIQMRKAEKLRGNVRIEFVCGTRAVTRARLDYRICAELSRLAGVPIAELPQSVSSLRDRLAAAEKERQRLALEMARVEGEALHRQAEPSPDGIRRLRMSVPLINESVRAKLLSFTGQGMAVAMALGGGSEAVLLACSADSGFNAGSIVKATLPRGGGSATLAQASLPDPALAAILGHALGFTTS